MLQNTVDSPSLLSMGFHPHSVDEIKERCVDAFPHSSTRREILDGLINIISMLESAGVEGCLWIDGSFATARINPGDADVVLVCQGSAYDNGSPDFRAVIDLVNSNLRASHKCDTYTLMEYPKGHPLYTDFFWNQSFYVGRWGWSDSIEAKGIITLQIGGQKQ